MEWFLTLLGEQTPPGFVFQALVLGQPLLFMWVYDNDWKIHEQHKTVFYLIAEAFIIIILVTKFQIGFYRTNLIIQYATLTSIAVFLYNTRYNIKQAICLGFLTAFLNSYYWELPLHIADFVNGPLHTRMVVQFWRLIPLLFFLERFKFNAKSRLFLSLGMGFSGIIMVLKFIVNLKFDFRLLYALNRLVCLLILVKVVMEADKK